MNKFPLLFSTLFICFQIFADSADVTLSFSESEDEIKIRIIPEHGLDIGRIRASEKKESVILVKNLTGKAINFDNWRSPCVCLEFDDTVESLKAEKEKRVIAVLDGSSYRGDFSKYMYIGFQGADSESQGFFLPVKFSVTGLGAAGKTSEIQKHVGGILYLDYDKEKQKSGIKGIKGYADSAAWIFAGRDCPNCNYLKKHVLPALFEKAEMQKPWRILTVDLNKKENFLFMLRLEERLGIKGKKTPVLYWKGRLYYGAKLIKKLLAGTSQAGIAYKTRSLTIAGIIAEDMKQGDITESSRKKLLVNRSKEITLVVILSAGLVDGINPCVFSTLVFFISLLSVSKIKGRKLLMTGGIYCLACFLSYLALGFGLFRFLKLFSGYKPLQAGLNMTIISVLGLFAILSFKDAWMYKKTGRANNVTLQLPSSVKGRIHAVMRSGLNYRYLIPGAFFIGVLVTALESVCTGQVYVPILVLLAGEAGGFSRWFPYLLLYNLMFIIPLLVIFAAAYWGMTTSKLLEWSKREVVISKVLLGVFFLLLGIFMIYLQ